MFCSAKLCKCDNCYYFRVVPRLRFCNKKAASIHLLFLDNNVFVGDQTILQKCRLRAVVGAGVYDTGAFYLELL